MEASDIIILIIAGCVGGFISGLLGVGGGIIFVPILDYFLTKAAVLSGDLVSFTLANSFFAIFISGLVGSFSAFKHKSINIKYLFAVAFSGILSILTISFIISEGNWYSPLVFKIVFCCLLIFTLIKTIIHKQNTQSKENKSIGLALIIGIIAGVTAGLTGLGGGGVMVPLFIIWGKMNMNRASAMSLAIIPLLVFPNIIYFAFSQPELSLKYSTGYLAWPIIVPLVIGVIIAVNVGVKVAKTMSAKTLKAIFAAFMIITIIKTLASVI